MLYKLLHICDYVVILVLNIFVYMFRDVHSYTIMLPEKWICCFWHFLHDLSLNNPTKFIIMAENIYLPLFTHYHLTQKAINSLDYMVHTFTCVYNWRNFPSGIPRRVFACVCVCVWWYTGWHKQGMMSSVSWQQSGRKSEQRAVRKISTSKREARWQHLGLPFCRSQPAASVWYDMTIVNTCSHVLSHIKGFCI